MCRESVPCQVSSSLPCASSRTDMVHVPAAEGLLPRRHHREAQEQPQLVHRGLCGVQTVHATPKFQPFCAAGSACQCCSGAGQRRVLYITLCMLLCVPCKTPMTTQQNIVLALYQVEDYYNRRLSFAHHQLVRKLFVGVGQQR